MVMRFTKGSWNQWVVINASEDSEKRTFDLFVTYM